MTPVAAVATIALTLALTLAGPPLTYIGFIAWLGRRHRLQREWAQELDAIDSFIEAIRRNT